MTLRVTEKANMAAKRRQGLLDNFFTVASKTLKGKCLILTRQPQVYQKCRFFEDTVEDEEVELHTEEEMAEEQNMEDVYHIFNLTECSSDIDSAFGAESEDDF